MPNALNPMTLTAGFGDRHEIRTAGTKPKITALSAQHLKTFAEKETRMGKGILLWLLGVPIPVIILLALFWH
jgi:hypothetical protein